MRKNWGGSRYGRERKKNSKIGFLRFSKGVCDSICEWSLQSLIRKKFLQNNFKILTGIFELRTQYVL